MVNLNNDQKQRGDREKGDYPSAMGDESTNWFLIVAVVV